MEGRAQQMRVRKDETIICVEVLHIDVFEFSSYMLFSTQYINPSNSKGESDYGYLGKLMPETFLFLNLIDIEKEPSLKLKTL